MNYNAYNEPLSKENTMFKQFVKDQHEMVTFVADTIESRSDRVVFYTSFWATLVLLPVAVVAIIALPIHLMRKAF
jgi:hypothetical protein